ncbi:MAG: hypothetical protein M1832_002578 [Thelocarpon impressellum]|nr:MAG: hypothetical protein M1832_002578 [Thelocarpon impressellum]
MDPSYHVPADEASPEQTASGGHHPNNSFEALYPQNNPVQSYPANWNVDPSYQPGQPHQAQTPYQAGPVAGYQHAPFQPAAFSQGPARPHDPSQYATFGPHEQQQFFNQQAYNPPLQHIAPQNTYGAPPSYGQTPTAGVRGYDMAALRPFADPAGQGTISPHALDPASQGTVSPRALQNPSVTPGRYLNAPANVRPRPPAAASHDLESSPSATGSDFSSLPSAAPAPPAGAAAGDFLVQARSVLLNTVAAAFLPRGAFAFIGRGPIDVPVSKSAIPRYVPRRSRHEAVAYLEAQKAGSSSSLVRSHKNKRRKLTVSKAPRAASTKVRSAKEAADPSPPETSEESDSGDSYYDSSEDEQMEQERAPLPAQRPEAPVDAIKYDTIKTLWRPSRRLLKGDEIKNGLGEYWQIIKPIRDAWGALDKAEAEKKGDIESVKKQIDQQRSLAAASVSAAVQHGHKDILERLGDMHPFISLLCSKILRDRYRADDVKGSLAHDTLQLLSRCITLPESILEKMGFIKLQPRLIKKGDDQTKALIEKINGNAAALKLKEEDAAKAAKAVIRAAQVPATSSERSNAASGPLASAKRPRADQDTGAQPPAKKAAPSASSSAAGGSSGAGMAKAPGMFDRRPAPAAAKPKPATTPAPSNGVKPKMKHVTAKPTNYFEGLAAASKQKPLSKPSGARSEKKAGAPTASMGASRPAFSLMDTVAQLSRPESAEATAEPVGKGPPETAEEKAKRLRKEQRRKLRVVFKPAGSLVEVRYFTVDQDEEDAPEGNLVMDAGDAMSEGRAFKQHMERDGLEDDDDAQGREESLHPYGEPIAVDFAVIAGQRELNSVRRGGLAEIDSPEREVREQHESNTLMVVYTDEGSIPRSPREPTRLEEADPSHEIVPFGLPPEEHMPRIRAAAGGKAPQAVARPAQAAATPDFSAAFTGPQAPQLSTSQPATDQAPLTELERVFAAFATPAAPPAPVAPPPPPVMQTPVVTPAVDIQAFLAALGAQPNQTPVPPPPVTPQVQAVLAQLGQVGVLGAPGALPGQGFAFQQNANQQQQQYPQHAQQQFHQHQHQQPQHPAQYGNQWQQQWQHRGGMDGAMDYDDQGNGDSYGEQGESGKGANGGKKKKAGDSDRRAAR